jgi:thymidine phosphorylase
VIFRKKVGDPLERGECVAIMYADRRDGMATAKSRIEGAIRIGSSKPEQRPLILSTIEIDDKNPEEILVRPWNS